MSAQFSMPEKALHIFDMHYPKGLTIFRHGPQEPPPLLLLSTTIGGVGFSIRPVEIVDRSAIHPVVPAVALLLLLVFVIVIVIIIIIIIIRPVSGQSSTQGRSERTSYSSPETKYSRYFFKLKVQICSPCQELFTFITMCHFWSFGHFSKMLQGHLCISGQLTRNSCNKQTQQSSNMFDGVHPRLPNIK